MPSMVLYELLSVSPVFACPLCDTDTGAQVREGILSASFIGNLVATLAPFIVLLLIIFGLHFGLPSKRALNHGEGQT
jgi:hypothetical protein